jgi:chromosome segregation ATPase
MPLNPWKENERETDRVKARLAAIEEKRLPIKAAIAAGEIPRDQLRSARAEEQRLCIERGKLQKDLEFLREQRRDLTRKGVPMSEALQGIEAKGYSSSQRTALLFEIALLAEQLLYDPEDGADDQEEIEEALEGKFRELTALIPGWREYKDPAINPQKQEEPHGK